MKLKLRKLVRVAAPLEFCEKPAMKLSAIPKGICSWNFVVSHESSAPFAEIHMGFGNSGSILFGQTRLEIAPRDTFEESWKVTEGKSVIFKVDRPSAFRNEFQFSHKEIKYLLKARSWLAQDFEVLAGDQVCGHIDRKHAFTRRALLDFEDDVPTLLQLLSLWYVVLLWQRASSG